MKNIKKLISVLLIAVMLLSIMPLSINEVSAASTLSEEEFANKIAELKNEYVHEKYWSQNNGTVSSGTYKGTSLVGNSACSSSYYYCDECGQFALNGTAYAWQCHGYALLLAHKIFGSNANNWSKYTDSSRQIYAGDVIRIDMDGDGVNDDYDHTIFVWKVTDSKIYYTDCNKTKPCQINWNGEMSISQLRSKFLYVRHLSGNTLTGEGKTTPILTVDYHANGANINSQITGYKYKVTDDAGVNLRSGAGTGNSVLVSLPKNTTFTVNEGDTATADGYTWGKTTYDGQTGWVVISDYVSKTATLRNTDFYLSSSMVYRTSSGSPVTHEIKYGTSPESGLYNYTTFKLEREGYKFIGWSLSADGSTTIFDQDDEVLKAEDICPDVKNGNKSVVLYAIWEEDIPIYHTISYNGNGGTGSIPSITLLKNDSFVIADNAFEKSNSTFLHWNVKRNNDNTWYVAGEGWLSESDILANGFTKKVYTSGNSYVLNDSWTNGLTGEGSYTLYAIWRDDSIKSIKINSIGNKSIYYVGDTLNTDELCIMAEKSDGSYELLTDGFTCSPSVLSNEGSQTITVSYQSFTTTYTVNVTKSKSRSVNGKAKNASTGYLLPSAGAQTISNQGAYANDTLQVLCKDGDFYLCFIPWGATSVTESNGVLLYISSGDVTLDSSVPNADEYYSLNSTGTKNATTNKSVYAYHRPDGGSTDMTFGGVSCKQMGPIASDTSVKVLFEMNGYYCIQTDEFTGFVDKSAISFLPIVTGIYVDKGNADLTFNVGDEILLNGLTVKLKYSNGTEKTITDYQSVIPSADTSGTKYAVVNYDTFYTYVQVEVKASEKENIGDLNGNGNIDVTDYILLKRCFFGNYRLDDSQSNRADINNSGGIEVMDYVLLKRVYFGTYRFN